jgi:metal transporter CNNM
VEDDLCPDESFIKTLHPAIQYSLLIILLLFSALFSGLTLGLMSLDLTGLEIVMAGDDPDAAKYAKRIYPIRKK